MSFDQTIDKLGLWPSRVLWLSAPLTAGPALGLLLQAQPSTPALIVEIGAWLLWFVITVAVLVPSPWSLTGFRVAAPFSLAVALLASTVDGWSDPVIGAVGWAAVTTSVAFMPTVADRMVNGSAYGSERRMALRAPGFALIGPVQLAWLAITAALIGPCWLLLTERYWLAAGAMAIGVAAIWAALRVLHQLSQRWVVFVPAGFVLRDPMLLLDAVLCRRNLVSSVGPAVVPNQVEAMGVSTDDGDETEVNRVDLSGGARGLSLEVGLKEATPLSLRQGKNATHSEATRLVFTPTLPGAMLREARIRGLRIGTVDPLPTGDHE